ncbi:MAG: hypothetical protein HOF76_04985 [Candidatus Scalindua sp.]|jgi:hypothetical protein|nr:hypothetical protein [Candidatus Scalindua sp.]MBT5304281.1 hypothetical protein [Candidatus Scalindua sp.]MBT6051068.1 hypothetical protein [Candidatus Scalindua sp.]MBT7212611.1 hypothetical protein [Candidatus Scalindua sp.]MBT7591675.1 hypothetical protein [Candidatus Scalindua sp.]
MKDNRRSIKNIAEKLGRGAKSASEEIRERLPAYIELLKTLARLGKNISLDVDNGVLKIREGFVNNYLSEVSIEDKGLRSIKVSCEDGNASFSIEFKKLLFDGIIKMPFTVEHFVFNKDERTVTFKFGEKKIDKVNNYYSKILFWFSLSVISIFYDKGDGIKNSIFSQDSLTVNPDGTHTIDLNKISELRELFSKNVVNVRYWDLISMDKLSFEKGLITLRLSRKLTNIVRTAIGIVEVLPKGRFIRPLLNRF